MTEGAGDRVLHPLAEAAIRSAIGSISGLAIHSLEERGDLHPAQVAIHLDGWSPSLNRFAMTWHVQVDAGLGAKDQAERMLRRLEQQMDIQRDRLAEGLSLGAAAPFGVCSMDGSGSRSDTERGHILIDRGLAALMEASREGGLDCEVSDSVFDLHQSDQGMRDGREKVLEGGSTDDHDDPMGRHALDGRVLTHDIRVGAGSLYDGARLRLDAQLPETLISAAIGRMLREIADVPAALAEHIVTGGMKVAEGTDITVEPKLVTLRELLGEIDAGGIRTG